MKDVISDIQLFGTPKQIELSKLIADQIAKSGKFDLDPILNDLRDHLRKDLGLEEINCNVYWLRSS